MAPNDVRPTRVLPLLHEMFRRGRHRRRRRTDGNGIRLYVGRRPDYTGGRRRG